METLEKLFESIENVKVIDDKISIKEYVLIDLSKNNLSLTPDVNKNNDSFEKYIEKHLEKNNAKVAFGGYLEHRTLYDDRDLFHENTKKRNIHLGIDFWVKAGTKILAPLDGKVHSFNYNVGDGNYGPTIILEHEIKNLKFYTLYGHLSLNSIENMEIGSVFKQTEMIGKLGDTTVNGNYVPHLHFQIIRDISNFFGDYPGVCSQENLSFYKNNCLDPNLLLKLKQ